MDEALDCRLRDKIIVLPVRFNFLHLGHEAYVRSVLACRPKRVYIFLGRCNSFRIPSDPLDDVERRFLLDAFLATLPDWERKKVDVFPVFNRELGEISWTAKAVTRWYSYCEALLKRRGLEPWDVIVSGNPYVSTQPQNLNFIDPYKLISQQDQVFLPNGEPVCATYVRALLYNGDERWRSYASVITATIVERQLAQFGMDRGPLEALRHRVRCEFEVEGEQVTVAHVVEDGEFKDHALIREIHGALLNRGLDACLSASSRAYEVDIEFLHPRQRYIVKLASVRLCPEEQILDYVFAARKDTEYGN